LQQGAPLARAVPPGHDPTPRLVALTRQGAIIGVHAP